MQESLIILLLYWERKQDYYTPFQKHILKKTFYPASKKMYCKDMKKITLENIFDSLENLTGEIKVEENIRKDALGAVQKMIDL